MKKTRIPALALAILAWAASPALARQDVPSTQVDPQVKSAAEAFAKTLPNTGISSVRETPVPGIFEIVAGDQIFYFSPAGYLFFGEMFTKDGKSLTGERRKELVADKLARIDLTQAFTLGKGPHQVIEFTDPDCPYCRKADEFLSKRTDLTRHIFFFPLPMHQNAAAHARYILCSMDQERAMREVFTGQWDTTPLPGTNDQCQNLLDAQMRIGASLGVRGTPTLWVDGTPVNGADTKTMAELLGRHL